LHGPLNVQSGNTVTFVPPNVSKEIAAEARDLLISKVGASLAWDTRNSFLLPSAGQKSEIRAELAGGIFGGDADYYKLEISDARYIRGFFEGHLLELAGRIGVGEAFGQSDDIPLFDRYFLGGLESLRGYKYRSIGPKDAFNEPLGGDTMWFA